MSCSCHCGCMKGYQKGRVGVFFHHLPLWQKNSKWHLQHDNFISFITLTTPMFEKQKTIKKNPFLCLGLKPRLSLSVISTHEALSLFLYCLPILYAQTTLAYSFLPNPFIASHHPCPKKTLKKASLMSVKLKQKGNCGIKNYSRMPNPDSCASLYCSL